MKKATYLLAALLTLASVLSVGAAPKKLLVVSVTTGFRHNSITALEKMLDDLSRTSGEYTVDFIHQPSNPAQISATLQALAPAALQPYDGVVFASTTGDLPIPDKKGFLDWIKAGHAFIGIHSASDTFHHWPEYIEMLGGEFQRHGAQVGVECLNQDPGNPANTALPLKWSIAQEEIYHFINFDPTKVHELLILDKDPNTKAPGHFPLSWCKDYGHGRVFYTALGHREDLIDPDPEMKSRINSETTAAIYDAHVLGGIEWALRIK